MIYEFIEMLEHGFKSIIHFFRAMFCTYYDHGNCEMQRKYFGNKFFCYYWNCPKRKGIKSE